MGNIPMNCEVAAVEAALKKHGSLKSISLKTKQSKSSQYANVVCFQKHICDALIALSKKPIPIELKDGRVIEQRLSIQYHNQRRVEAAREKWKSASMEKRLKHQ